MNYFQIIYIILFFFSITDFINPRDVRFHKNMYNLAFFSLFLLCFAKYYFGPDIAAYNSLYSSVPNVVELFQGYKLNTFFEKGFAYFCSILKLFNISFWGMTAVVTCIYFYALHKLFKLIPTKRCLALLILVIFDKDLMFIQYRQCLAISFYILMYLSYINKKNIKVLIYAVLAALFHKSAFIFVFPSLILLYLPIVIKSRTYFICFITFLLVLFLPWQAILLKVIRLLGFSSGIVLSLEYHLSHRAGFQIIFVIYSLILLLLSVIELKDNKFMSMNKLMFVSWILVIMSIHFPAMQGRMRSYLIPFLIVYLFNACYYFRDSTVVQYNRFIISDLSKSIVCYSISSLLILFSFYTLFTGIKKRNTLESGLYNSSTIFELFRHSKDELIERQKEKARIYWATEKDMSIGKNK